MWDGDRSRRGPAARVTVALVAAVLGVACESPPRNFLAPGHGGAGARRLLVFPVNAFVALPYDLEVEVDRVDRELEQYLVDHAKSVERLDRFAARRAWHRAARAAAERAEAAEGDGTPPPAEGGSDDAAFRAALRELAPALATSHAFDALLVPAIVPRPAVLQGQTVTWDGVSRRLVIPRMPPMRNNDIVYDTPWAGRTEIQAPSLWAVVALPDGTRAFEGLGGLDLTIRVEWFPPKLRDGFPRIGFVPLEDPFSDAEALREGIAEALRPYLPYRPARPEREG